MMTRTPPPDAGSHATHDRLAVAALAAGDLSGTDQIHASALVATCEACGILLTELRSIAVATRGLPPPIRAAARDFRISPNQALSLARGASWRRLLRPFGRQGNTTIRPLAAMLSTLGVAGLLLAALPLLPFAGGSASMGTAGGPAEVREAPVEVREAPAAASLQPEFRLLASPTVDRSGGEFSGDAKAGAVSEPTSGEAADPSPAPDAAERSDLPAPLVLVSLAFLSAGLGLFLLRRAAQRLR